MSASGILREVTLAGVALGTGAGHASAGVVSPDWCCGQESTKGVCACGAEPTWSFSTGVGQASTKPLSAASGGSCGGRRCGGGRDCSGGGMPQGCAGAGGFGCGGGIVGYTTCAVARLVASMAVAVAVNSGSDGFAALRLLSVLREVALCASTPLLSSTPVPFLHVWVCHVAHISAPRS